MLLTSFHISVNSGTVCIVCIFSNTFWNKIDSILFPKNNCICGKAADKADGKQEILNHSTFASLEKKTKTRTDSSSKHVWNYLVGNDYIVNGEEAERHRYPWQVMVAKAGTKRPKCGGSLVSSRHVLTAAHCFVHTSSEPAPSPKVRQSSGTLRKYIRD